MSRASAARSQAWSVGAGDRKPRAREGARALPARRARARARRARRRARRRAARRRAGWSRSSGSRASARAGCSRSCATAPRTCSGCTRPARPTRRRLPTWRGASCCATHRRGPGRRRRRGPRAAAPARGGRRPGACAVAAAPGHRARRRRAADARGRGAGATSSGPRACRRSSSRSCSALLSGPRCWRSDDGHLMDHASAGLLGAVARAATMLPWLVVVTCRDTGTGFSAPRGLGVVRLELAPLGPTEALALAEAVTEESPLPPHVVEARGRALGRQPAVPARPLARRAGRRRRGRAAGLDRGGGDGASGPPVAGRSRADLPRRSAGRQLPPAAPGQRPGRRARARRTSAPGRACGATSSAMRRRPNAVQAPHRPRGGVREPALRDPAPAAPQGRRAPRARGRRATPTSTRRSSRCTSRCAGEHEKRGATRASRPTARARASRTPMRRSSIRRALDASRALDIAPEERAERVGGPRRWPARTSASWRELPRRSPLRGGWSRATRCEAPSCCIGTRGWRSTPGE